MEISFHAKIRKGSKNSYVVTIPKAFIKHGVVKDGEKRLFIIE